MGVVTLEQLFSIKGRTAIVTDSDGNASSDVALVLAGAGARVAIGDTAVEKAQSAVDEILADGGEAMAISADVEDQASVAALFAQVNAAWGSPDILVNCAAMTNNEAIPDFTAEAWDEVMSIDLRSVFFCMREAIRYMVPAGRGGRIVNVTSMGAERAVLLGNAAYCAARSGVNGLMRAAAIDHVRDGILVNCVLPGAVHGKVRQHSNFQSRLREGKITGPGVDVERRLPLGFGQARDIAAAVLFLVGPSGGYMTGQTITLDGGFLIS